MNTTPGDLSARLQAWLLRHDLNDARSTETRALVSEAAAALSALPAGGGDEVPEDWTRFTFHDQRIACHPSIADRVQRALLREATTPPPDAAVVEWDGATRTMREHLYLMTGERDRYKALHEQAAPTIARMERRIAELDADVGAQGEGKRYTQADLNAEYTRGRCDGFDAAAPAAGKGDPINPAFWIQAIRTACYTTDCSPKQQTLLNAADNLERYIALTQQPEGKGVDDASERQPDGYAYRYADGFIRHNGGRDHNGMRPTETIPFYYGSAPALTRQPVAGDGK